MCVCESEVAIPMNGKVEDFRVVCEYGLTSIAMMDIPINNQNSFESEGGGSMSGSNSYVVEYTESHSTISLRMVTWWPSDTCGRV